jgi:hypothetical protein
MQLRPFVQAGRDWMLTYALDPAGEEHAAEWMKIDRDNTTRGCSKRAIECIREETED